MGSRQKGKTHLALKTNLHCWIVMLYLLDVKIFTFRLEPTIIIPTVASLRLEYLEELLCRRYTELG